MNNTNSDSNPEECEPKKNEIEFEENNTTEVEKPSDNKPKKKKKRFLKK